MGRRQRKTGLDSLAALPWPLGIVAGIIGFIAVRYGFVWWMGNHGGILAQGFNPGMGAKLAPLAWMLLAICWLAALMSFIGSRHRRSLVDTRTTLDSLAAPGWRQFEMLVGEAFHRQGYSVEETGLGGADGGIDLILRKDGRRTLVQCKQWKRKQVGVSTVREMAGLLAHHQADAVKIVCIGTYTKAAERFAQDKSIELIGGEQLLAMIQAVQRVPESQAGAVRRIEPTLAPVANAPSSALSCPRCGSAMVERKNHRTGEAFQGCTHFPRCRGTR